MPWLKYRHKFAWGKGSWEWRFIGRNTPTSFVLADFLRELADEHDDGDKYRGLDHEIVAVAPAWIIAREIELNDQRFKNAEAYALVLDEMREHAKPCSACNDAPPMANTMGFGRMRDCVLCGRMNQAFEPYEKPRRRGA